MAELRVNNLYLDYGSGAAANAILKGVSMELQRGEVVALLGPSGSGKTTLLRAVAGLESPKAGTINIGERVVFDGERKFEPRLASEVALLEADATTAPDVDGWIQIHRRQLEQEAAKLASSLRPSSPDFSGWNCVANRFSRATAATTGPP